MKRFSLKSLFEPVSRLYLATKLANPHYKPEIAAQTTLVNFCVTEEGLEEQLLDAVVAHERPDLQLAAAALVRQLAEYTITLTSLEDNLLMRLANSQVRCCDLVHLLTQILASVVLHVGTAECCKGCILGTLGHDIACMCLVGLSLPHDRVFAHGHFDVSAV